jgi:hypothetical protein
MQSASGPHTTYIQYHRLTMTHLVRRQLLLAIPVLSLGPVNDRGCLHDRCLGGLIARALLGVHMARLDQIEMEENGFPAAVHAVRDEWPDSFILLFGHRVLGLGCESCRHLAGLLDRLPRLGHGRVGNVELRRLVQQDVGHGDAGLHCPAVIGGRVRLELADRFVPDVQVVAHLVLAGLGEAILPEHVLLEPVDEAEPAPGVPLDRGGGECLGRFAKDHDITDLPSLHDLLEDSLGVLERKAPE